MTDAPADGTRMRVPADYEPARDGTAPFAFADEATYPCFPLGSTWNGFDNVEVSVAVRDLVLADWRAIEGMDPDTLADLSAIDPSENGRICLGWGWATQLDDDERTDAVITAGDAA